MQELQFVQIKRQPATADWDHRLVSLVAVVEHDTYETKFYNSCQYGYGDSLLSLNVLEKLKI